MLRSKIYARVLIPAATLVAADTKTKDPEKYFCKPSELPIYVPDSKPKKKEEIALKELGPPSRLELFFSSIRKNLFSMYHEVKVYKKKGEDFVNDTVENADWLVKYLQEEENTNAKYGAIAIGGLTGYILGLRGGYIRRFTFTAAGAGIMASICYPKEAAEYSELAFQEARRYATIGYNFIYGVKEGEPALQLPSLPKIPSSFTELWSSISGTEKSSTATSANNDNLIQPIVTEPKIEAEVNEVKNLEGSEKSFVDPLALVTQVHEEASSNECHCPIGVCISRHEDEGFPVTQEKEPPCPEP